MVLVEIKQVNSEVLPAAGSQRAVTALAGGVTFCYLKGPDHYITVNCMCSVYRIMHACKSTGTIRLLHTGLLFQIACELPDSKDPPVRGKGFALTHVSSTE